MDKNKVIESAAKLIAKGSFEKAVKEYQRVLEVDPDDVRVLQKLAELYQKMQRREESADCFEKVAKTYAAQGFFLKAVALYKQVLKVVDRIEVNHRLAELYQQLGLIGDATKEWQNVAAHYEKIGDLKSSLDTLRRLVDLDPDNVAARIRLGEQYARQDNLVEAVAELRRAAAYLQRNGRTDDYLRVAERISHLDQGDVPLAKELAEHYLSRGDSKRALAKLQICFKANPRDLGTLQMLARAFQELGQVSKTVSVLKELARVHADAGRSDEAQRVYKQALDLAPDDAELRASLTALESQPAPVVAPPAPARAPTNPSGHPAVAVRPPTNPGFSALRPASSPGITPALRPTTSKLTQTTAPIAPPAPARTTPPLVTPASNGPVSVAKLLKETEVYVKYGLHEKAAEHLKRIFALEPDNTDAHEKMRQLAAATGRPADAVPSLARLVELYSARSDPRAAEVRDQLASLEPGHPALGAAPQLGSAEEVVVLDDSDEQHETVDADDSVVVLDAEHEVHEPSILVDEDVPAPVAAHGDHGELVADDAEVEVLAEPEEALDAPVAAQPAPAHGDDAFASDLAEADFYLQQGLADDARAILEAILLAEPHHAGAQRLLAGIGDAEHDSGSTMLDARPVSLGGDDLAAELAAELASEVADLGEAADPDESLASPENLSAFQVPADEVLGAFKAKLQETVRPEDAQTHYDLGIAYKEMGLLDEAISEFEIALSHGGGVRKLDCITTLGLCAMEKGRVEDAVQVFRRGLDEPDLPESAKRALSFELGNAYETLGESGLALQQYEDVERAEPGFRDVAARIQRLGGTVSGPKPRPVRRTVPPPARPVASASAPPPPAAQRTVPPPVATRPPPAAVEAPVSSADTKPGTDAGTSRNRKIGFV